MSPNTQAKIEGIASDLGKNTPSLLVMLILVFMFGFYLDRQSLRADHIADLRIEQCHGVQKESMAVMKELASTLREQGGAFAAMTITLEMHMEHIEEKVDDLAERVK